MSSSSMALVTICTVCHMPNCSILNHVDKLPTEQNIWRCVRTLLRSYEVDYHRIPPLDFIGRRLALRDGDYVIRLPDYWRIRSWVIINFDAWNDYDPTFYAAVCHFALRYERYQHESLIYIMNILRSNLTMYSETAQFPLHLFANDGTPFTRLPNNV